MKLLDVLKVILLISVANVNPLAHADLARPSSARCVRPKDFSNASLVASYEACLKKLRAFCESSPKEKDCLAFDSEQKALKISQSTKEPKASDRCRIEKDGSYKCEQDPIKLLNINPGGPAPAASASPGSSSSGDTSGAASGSAGVPSPENPPPVVLPPLPGK